MRRVVSEPTWNVEPDPTWMIFSLKNAILPEVVSDSTEIDTPVPIFTCFGVLKKTFRGEV